MAAGGLSQGWPRGLVRESDYPIKAIILYRKTAAVPGAWRLLLLMQGFYCRSLFAESAFQIFQAVFGILQGFFLLFLFCLAFGGGLFPFGFGSVSLSLGFGFFCFQLGFQIGFGLFGFGFALGFGLGGFLLARFSGGFLFGLFVLFERLDRVAFTRVAVAQRVMYHRVDFALCGGVPP